MKTAFFAFVLSFSAMANDCFIRKTELVTNEVTLAREICILSTDLKLEVFGNSKATINYTLDGVQKAKVINLSNPITLRDGKVLFFVWGLENNFEGGGCGDTVEASIDAELTMNPNGSEVLLGNIKGSVSTSNDNCHSDLREIQSFNYEK